MTTINAPRPKCLYCHRPFSGNDNKKFCTDRCKNAFHNNRRKHETKEIGRIVTILKTNRRILEELLTGRDKRNIHEQELLDKGFIFRYHTHRRTNKGDNKEYYFCFDYGYLALSNRWYMIVQSFKRQDD